MDFIHNTSKKENKPFVVSDKHLPVTQIDTIGPLLAEIYKIVQRMDKREEELHKKLSGMKNDY